MNQEHYLNGRKRLVYTFPKTREEFDDIKKTDDITFFYQLTMFNDSKGKFHMRKFVVDSNDNFIKIDNYLLNKKQYKNFFKEYANKRHKYKLYNTRTLDEINPPTLNDINTTRSSNLVYNNENNLNAMYEPFTSTKYYNQNRYQPQYNKYTQPLADNVVSDYANF